LHYYHTLYSMCTKAAFLQGPAEILTPGFEEEVIPMLRTEILADVSVLARISPIFTISSEYRYLLRSLAAICINITKIWQLYI
jgi:hypothetical protein